MTTTIEVITRAEYETKYAERVGSLMFTSQWWDIDSYVDKKKLRKNIKDQLPKGKKILKVLVAERCNPRYKNVANLLVPYEYPVCAIQTQDGAYYNPKWGNWEVKNPLGDAIIVISN